LIEKALSFSPNNPKYFVSLVEIKYNKDQKEQAVNLMEKVIKLRPTNLSYLSAIATLYEELGDINLAKKYYFKMLEIEPTNDEAKNKLKLLK
jgi:cytochrome c-type biogenesis protein CcmH/NrfG